MTKRGTCGGCEWWVNVPPDTAHPNAGRCHGYGPINIGTEGNSYWPATMPHDAACPKFEPRQEQDGGEE